MSENENTFKNQLQASSETDSEPEHRQDGAATPYQESSVSYVSLIQDPFGLHTLEISEAQNSPDETPIQESIAEDDLEEDEAFEVAEDAGALDRLSSAMGEAHSENKKNATDWAANASGAVADWTPDAEAGAKQAGIVAAEIAEDQALQAAIATEVGESEQDPELLAALPSTPASVEELDIAEVQSCVEAILFMTDKPLSLENIQEMLGPDFPHSVFQEAMTALVDRYRSSAHGIEIAQIANGYQLRTKTGRAALVKKLSKVQVQRLSTGAMESLAIVAYRQPVMKEDIDKIRGVDSSYFVRHLLDRKLIQICGRSELPGRPMLYSTTDEFLSMFGLKNLSAMPSLREIEQMVPASQSGNSDDEDPRVKEMRRLVGQMKADNSTNLSYDPREDEVILKEIRERVQAIPSSTPYLDQQKELEKQAKTLAAQGLTPEMIETTLKDEAVQPELQEESDQLIVPALDASS